MTIRRQHGKRRGATAVETAFVLLPLFVFLFGILEYCWLLANWNLLNNAAREGCRFAIVNNTDPTLSTDVQTTVNQYMAGASSNFNAFTVSVSGTHQGVATAVNNLAPGDLVVVSVSGQYRFLDIIPGVPMPATAPISSSVTMVCEGGT